MAKPAALDIMHPTASVGLTSAEAARRLAAHGANAVAEQTPPPWRLFLGKFWAPVPWLLEAAIVLELLLGQHIEAVVIGGLLLFNVTLGFVQEARAGTALAALKKRLAPTAIVRRDGQWMHLPAADLVPGDVIRLPLGALVPADATLVTGAVLVDQSMLTGESVPVDVAPGDKVYAGALVRRGQAVAEVTATGAKTYFGRTAELVRVAHAASTEQTATFAATRNLVVVNGTVVILIIVSAYFMALPTHALIRLALTGLLATMPVALPATFALSAALTAQDLAKRGVLLTRLSAAHEAAAMDVLCADKTGTLTRNELQVVDVLAMPGFDRGRVLALAALASSDADQDPIDAAIRAAAAKDAARAPERLQRFIPFDPAVKTSEAFALDAEGHELRIAKGAFERIGKLAIAPADARQSVDRLAAQGDRIIAVAAGAPDALRLCGLIAVSDPPRADSAALIGALHDMKVRTVMVTGDSAVTAATIAGMIGITGAVCPADKLSEQGSAEHCGVIARVLPEQKYQLVQTLQRHGHAVGMCGDGVNDAPALRQAQIGIAVSTATDVAKAAASMVLTAPGLAGVVDAVREGRLGFQRMLTYTFNMLVKKIEIVLFLAIGLALTGEPVLTPAIMILLILTNDFLAMSITTDRASPAPAPSVWRMRNITAASIVLAACKLVFSTAVLAVGKFRLGFGVGELQTLAFVTLAFGNQAILYVLRERGPLWRSRPSNWLIASSVAGTALVAVLAFSGTLMAPLGWRVLVAVFVASAGFALVLDRIKLPVTAWFKVE